MTFFDLAELTAASRPVTALVVFGLVPPLVITARFYLDRRPWSALRPTGVILTLASTDRLRTGVLEPWSASVVRVPSLVVSRYAQSGEQVLVELEPGCVVRIQSVSNVSVVAGHRLIECR